MESINVNTMMPKYKEKLADDKRRMDEVKVKIETKTASAGISFRNRKWSICFLGWMLSIRQALKKAYDHRSTGGAHWDRVWLKFPHQRRAVHTDRDIRAGRQRLPQGSWALRELFCDCWSWYMLQLKRSFLCGYYNDCHNSYYCNGYYHCALLLM